MLYLFSLINIQGYLYLLNEKKKKKKYPNTSVIFSHQYPDFFLFDKSNVFPTFFLNRVFSLEVFYEF